jgi:excisionase family DNA binding protein
VVQEIPGQFLKVGEVAARLRVSRATVYRWVESGTFPVLRISNSIRVPASVVPSWRRA